MNDEGVARCCCCPDLATHACWQCKRGCCRLCSIRFTQPTGEVALCRVCASPAVQKSHYQDAANKAVENVAKVANVVTRRLDAER